MLGEGFHMVGLSKEIIHCNIREHKEIDELKCVLADNNEVRIKYQFRYKASEVYLAQLYRDIGKYYPEKYVIPSVRKLVRDTLQYYNTSELSKDYISEILVAKVVNEKSWNYIILTELYLIDVKYSTIVESAIEFGILSELNALDSKDPLIRFDAIRKLLENGSPAAYNIIFEHWPKERDIEIKDYIIKMISSK
ncbi:MAG: hypothetical protein HQ521_03070 [Bacteroidetes bacterium]|nr:hypothetical protein [Bacteroidota bacterium]